MSLSIDSVFFDGFRGYTRFSLSALGRLTLLVGPNAVGKTNVIEGIELLTAAESFRRPSWGETVSWGSERAVLSCRLVEGPRDVEHRLTITGNERTYEVNGKRRRASDVRADCPCVLFIPDDLQLVKASSAKRRRAADAIGGRLSASYAALADDYRQTLMQRNLLLKEGIAPGPLLESWNEALAVNGARLSVNRMRLFSRLARRMERAYAAIVGGEELTCAYLPSWERFDERGRQIDDIASADGLPPARDLSVDQATELLEGLEARLADAEARRKTTLPGPHKDEMAFFVNGKNARLFASQGQQRTIVLAWKLAEVGLVAEIAGTRPVLLLDDVMSELDGPRREALAGFFEASAQTFVTTTNLGYFSESALAAADVVELPIPGTRPGLGGS